MPTGFSVKLPLIPDAVDGFYKLNKSFAAVIQQNFKMLLMTTPGERVMIPNFGVGVRNMLFENSPKVVELLNTRIKQQIKRYLPYVVIQALEIVTMGQQPPGQSIDYIDDANTLGLSVVYFVPSLNVTDIITIFNK